MAALAFLPSCLMLAVTAHISTDVAADPAALGAAAGRLPRHRSSAAFARRSRQCHRAVVIPGRGRRARSLSGVLVLARRARRCRLLVVAGRRPAGLGDARQVTPRTPDWLPLVPTPDAADRLLPGHLGRRRARRPASTVWWHRCSSTVSGSTFLTRGCVMPAARRPGCSPAHALVGPAVPPWFRHGAVAVVCSSPCSAWATSLVDRGRAWRRPRRRRARGHGRRRVARDPDARGARRVPPPGRCAGRRPRRRCRPRWTRAHLLRQLSRPWRDDGMHVLSHGTTMHGTQFHATTSVEASRPSYYARPMGRSASRRWPWTRTPTWASSGSAPERIAAYGDRGQHITLLRDRPRDARIAQDARLLQLSSVTRRPTSTSSVGDGRLDARPRARGRAFDLIVARRLQLRLHPGAPPHP